MNNINTMGHLLLAVANGDNFSSPLPLSPPPSKQTWTNGHSHILFLSIGDMFYTERKPFGEKGTKRAKEKSM